MSLNVRGIADKIKRKGVFEFYRNIADIVVLQETHSVEKDENLWRNEWGGRILFSHGETNARGVCILFKRGYYCNIENVTTDYDGRVICCELHWPDTDIRITLCNIYAPNRDSPAFYDALSQRLADYCEHKIIIGDYNLVMDVKMDRSKSSFNYVKARSVLQNLIEEYSLCDIWQERNPVKIRYSWNRGKHCSRIDFALLSRGIDQMCEHVQYTASTISDHSALYLTVDTVKNTRGAGYWKLNTNLLKSRDIVDEVKALLRKDIISSISNNKHKQWQYIKDQVAKHFKKISRRQSNDKKAVISALLEKADEMESRLPLNKEEMELYLRTKADIVQLQNERAKGIIFRSRVQWAEEGELNTRYFYNLEKVRANGKSATLIILDTGNKLTENSDILQEQHRYYSELYRKDAHVEFGIKNNKGVKISDRDRIKCEKTFSTDEVYQAVKSMRLNRSPGNDGLPIEFYVTFWEEIKEVFMDMIQYSFDNHRMPPKTNTGVLNLIPKPGKDSRFLKNLRPITLLNCDYKIIEKVLARRMDPTLQYLIHPDQTGFLPNRSIASNIRKVIDLMDYCEVNNLDAFILDLDFAKCFDKISKDCVLGALTYFQYPSFIINWVDILYTNFQVVIQNNGNFSDFVSIEKSVHQGGCLSVQLFLLCAELIAIELRQCEKVQGIPVQDIIMCLNQYADDMDITSLFKQESLDAILERLAWFNKNSGFELSYEKTNIMRIGSMRTSIAELYTQKSINWTNNAICVLGICIGNDKQTLYSNYYNLMPKVKSILASWVKRNLSLLGKVNIINTLIISQFIYRLFVLPNMPSEIIKKLTEMFQDFLWNGKRPKIPIQMLAMGRAEGGLRLTNIEIRQQAIKVKWLQILKRDQRLSTLVYSLFKHNIGEDVWCTNLLDKDLKDLIDVDRFTFWSQVLSAWNAYRAADERISSDDCLLWFNSEVKIGEKTVFFREAYDRGLKFVKDIKRGEGFMPCDEACRTYGLSVMKYNQLINAIPKSWKMEEQSSDIYSYIDSLCNRKDVSKTVYNKLLVQLSCVNNIRHKWNEKDGVKWDTDQTVQLCVNIQKTSNIPKLRSFQYRLLHRALVLNIHMVHWGICDSDLCTFCEEERETIRHLFYDCKIIADIWNKLKKWISVRFKTAIVLSYENVIANNIVENNPKHVINMICLTVKQYIYRRRAKEKTIDFNSVKMHIWNCENVEKYMKNDTLSKHNLKWGT